MKTNKLTEELTMTNKLTEELTMTNKLTEKLTMKKRITQTIQALALGLMALCLAIPAADAQVQQAWVASYNGVPPIPTWQPSDWVNDMVVRDGFVYVTGYESAATAYWATVKYDYDGQELWVQRLVDGQSQHAEAMAVDAAGNVYVTGWQKVHYTTNDIDVVTLKYSPDGDTLWERRYNSAGGNNQPNDIAIDASGDIYVAGASWIDDHFDLLLLKYDSDGELLWDRTLDNGDEQWDVGYALSIDPNGNAIVAGYSEPAAYLVKYSPTGDLLWQEEHENFAPWDEWTRVETDAEGNIYVLGEISPPFEPKYFWTAKYDPNGNILWEQSYTGTADEACYDGNLAIMPDGGVVVCGQSWEVPNNNKIVTIRYAPDGTELWQQLENAGYVSASGDDVAVDAEGNIYVTGYGFNYSYWNDIITLGYTPDGDLLWTQIYAGPEPDQSDYPQVIAVDEDANVFVTGHSWDPETSDNFTTIMYTQEITQTIPLNTGYQFVSSRIDVTNPDMLVVLQGILNENLDFVRNSEGTVLRKIGPNWVNGIGDWISTEGYLIKMYGTETLALTGDVVNPLYPINLTMGYQFVSFLPEVSIDAIVAFEGILSDDLDYIRNSNGEMLRKIGPNWVNGLGDANPGEGYLIKMYADDLLVYNIPTEITKSSTLGKVMNHFVFEGGNAADPVYSIYVSGLNIGDEVAVFDGEKMVGASVVVSENVLENPVPIFSTLASGEGYKEGNEISMKVWDSNSTKIIESDFTFETEYEAYSEKVFPTEDGKYSIANVIKGSSVSINEILIYPNPATDLINISSANEIQNVSIFNYVGQKIFSGNTNQINSSNLEAGIYLIKIKTKEGIETQKITIK